LRYGHRSEDDRWEGDILFGPTREEGFGPEVKRRIVLGTYTLSSEAIGNYFLQAQRVRRLVQQDFDAVFSLPNVLLSREAEVRPEGVDAIVAPTALSRPPTLREAYAQKAVEAYANDILTVPASLAGIPSVNVPVQTEDWDGEETTVGIQVMAQWGDEKRMWNVAEMVERMHVPGEFKRDVGVREDKAEKL
jgi:aspartyl-tRNA(Asn)/glutamyl-tRNA(Gln) amidotransferase subunit A